VLLAAEHAEHAENGFPANSAASAVIALS